MLLCQLQYPLTVSNHLILILAFLFTNLSLYLVYLIAVIIVIIVVVIIIMY